MRPEDVDAALVEKFANALGLAWIEEKMPEYARNLRLGLAAVLPEIQAQALEEGYSHCFDQGPDDDVRSLSDNPYRTTEEPK